MESAREVSVGLAAVLFVAVAGGAADREPLCLSRYDYDYKMLQKMFDLEQEQRELRQLVEKQAEVVARMETQVKADIQRLVSQVQDASGRGSTYVRWGRSTCPGNGTAAVYTGYAAGSHYNQPGGAANYLCLPSDPTWGRYDDATNGHHKIWGAEYQISGTYSERFFGTSVIDNDAPCAVCLSSRTSHVMIPGRTACYDEWTLEYSGYLAVGHDTQNSATEFVCLDADPELIPGGGTDHNGKLFYMVEVKCDPLKCPPYVQDRELACVVCTK